MNKSINELNKMISTGDIELYTKDYVNNLQQKIDKAIEYIEKREFVEVEIINEPFSDDFDFKKKNILKILRGENNE